MAFSTHDQVPDSPTNVFATLNPLENYATGTFSDGNTKGVTTSSGYGRFISTIRPTTGKYYCEFYIVDASRFSVGIENSKTAGGTQGGATENSLIVFYNGNGYYNNTSYASYLTSNLANGNIVGVALDLDNKNIFISVNGTYAKSATLTEIQNGTSTNSLNTHCSVTQSVLFDGDIGIFFEDNSSSGLTSAVANFGADSTFGGLVGTSPLGSEDTGATFRYAPPNDFKALCTANIQSSLAIDPAVDDLPEDNFKAVTWTGNNTGTSRTIDVGFGADLIWTKKRSAGGVGAGWHQIYDTVRGYNSSLNSNTTNSETTSFNNSDDHGYLDLFTSSGFRFTDGSNTTYPRHYYNENGETYVAWCWKAGGSPSGSNIYMKDDVGYTSSTSDKATVFGNASNYTITPASASINTKAGFSIVKYTASTSIATVPHGLSKKPELMIFKNIDTTSNWDVITDILNGSLQYLWLNSTNKVNTTGWGSSPTDLVMSVYSYNANMIAYCWHSVAGYSAFGSYTGNGSTDGPFVYTGFKPAWVMIFEYSFHTRTYSSWYIFDNARDPNNPMNKVLYANLTVGEGYRGDGSTASTTSYMDFLSNGFKPRGGQNHNANGDSHIYIAFAEQPFKYANAR